MTETVSLVLHSLPTPGEGAGCERTILTRFLEAIGKARPQLVGFNSLSSDLMILLQRSMVHRLHLPDFCRRPDKPWEGIDYFSKALRRAHRSEGRVRRLGQGDAEPARVRHVLRHPRQDARRRQLASTICGSPATSAPSSATTSAMRCRRTCSGYERPCSRDS